MLVQDCSVERQHKHSMNRDVKACDPWQIDSTRARISALPVLHHCRLSTPDLHIGSQGPAKANSGNASSNIQLLRHMYLVGPQQHQEPTTGEGRQRRTHNLCHLQWNCHIINVTNASKCHHDALKSVWSHGSLFACLHTPSSWNFLRVRKVCGHPVP